MTDKKIKVSGLVKLMINDKSELTRYFNSFYELIEIVEKLKKGDYSV